MDKDNIEKLVKLGSKAKSIQKIQDIAAKAMKKAGLGYTLHNACAATLSAFLNEVGIKVPMTLGAGKLASRLRDGRHWDKITVGKQQAGDVGVAFDEAKLPGTDHVYLVIERVGADKMMIADNQAPKPHVRYVSGHGKTATEYFLRAPEDENKSKLLYGTVETIEPDNEDFFPWNDEDTNSLVEPFQDDGTPSPSTRETLLPTPDIDELAARLKRLEEHLEASSFGKRGE